MGFKRNRLYLSNPNYTYIDLLLRELEKQINNGYYLKSNYKSYDKNINDKVIFKIFDIKSSLINNDNFILKEFNLNGQLDFEYIKSSNVVLITSLPTINVFNKMDIPLFTHDLANIIVKSLKQLININDVNIMFANFLTISVIDSKVKDIIPSIINNSNYISLQKVIQKISAEIAKINKVILEQRAHLDKLQVKKEKAVAKKTHILGIDPKNYKSYEEFVNQLNMKLNQVWSTLLFKNARHLESTKVKYKLLLKQNINYFFRIIIIFYLASKFDENKEEAKGYTANVKLFMDFLNQKSDGYFNKFNNDLFLDDKHFMILTSKDYHYWQDYYTDKVEFIEKLKEEYQKDNKFFKEDRYAFEPYDYPKENMIRLLAYYKYEISYLTEYKDIVVEYLKELKNLNIDIEELFEISKWAGSKNSDNANELIENFIEQLKNIALPSKELYDKFLDVALNFDLNNPLGFASYLKDSNPNNYIEFDTTTGEWWCPFDLKSKWKGKTEMNFEYINRAIKFDFGKDGFFPRGAHNLLKYHPILSLEYTNNDFRKGIDLLRQIKSLEKQKEYYEFASLNPTKALLDIKTLNTCWGYILKNPYWFRTSFNHFEDYSLLMIMPGITNIDLNKIPAYRVRSHNGRYYNTTKEVITFPPSTCSRLTLTIPSTLKDEEINKLFVLLPQFYETKIGEYNSDTKKYGFYLNIICDNPETALKIKKIIYFDKNIDLSFIDRIYLNLDPDYYSNFIINTPDNDIFYEQYNFSSAYKFKRNYVFDLHGQESLALTFIEKKTPFKEGDKEYNELLELLLLGDYSNNKFENYYFEFEKYVKKVEIFILERYFCFLTSHNFVNFDYELFNKSQYSEKSKTIKDIKTKVLYEEIKKRISNEHDLYLYYDNYENITNIENQLRAINITIDDLRLIHEDLELDNDCIMQYYWHQSKEDEAERIKLSQQLKKIQSQSFGIDEDISYAFQDCFWSLKKRK